MYRPKSLYLIETTQKLDEPKVNDSRVLTDSYYLYIDQKLLNKQINGYFYLLTGLFK